MRGVRFREGALELEGRSSWRSGREAEKRRRRRQVPDDRRPHYLQVRDTHFDLAAGIGQGTQNPASNPASPVASNPATRMRPRDPAETQNRQKPKKIPHIWLSAGLAVKRRNLGKCPPKDSNLRPAD